MARSSEKAIAYQARAEKMEWADLLSLWEAIKKDDTPGWDDGAALEYLVVRAFQIGGRSVEYPYNVPPGGKTLEQIDGLVYLDSIAFLLECKDKETTDIAVIAKLRNQLLRRPDTAFGCVFVTGDFTAPALILADYAVPQRILLWSNVDIEEGLNQGNFSTMLQSKYWHLCKYGFTDRSPNFRGVNI